MSDDKELNEQDLKLFAKGFNSGYLMEKENPALAKELIEGNQNKDNNFFKGVIAGSKEQKREKYLEEANEIEIKRKDKSKTGGKER